MLLCNNLASRVIMGELNGVEWKGGGFTHIAARYWEFGWEKEENGGYDHVYDAELL